MRVLSRLAVFFSGLVAVSAETRTTSLWESTEKIGSSRLYTRTHTKNETVTETKTYFYLTTEGPGHRPNPRIRQSTTVEVIYVEPPPHATYLSTLSWNEVESSRALAQYMTLSLPKVTTVTAGHRRENCSILVASMRWSCPPNATLAPTGSPAEFNCSVVTASTSWGCPTVTPTSTARADTGSRERSTITSPPTTPRYTSQSPTSLYKIPAELTNSFPLPESVWSSLLAASKGGIDGRPGFKGPHARSVIDPSEITTIPWFNAATASTKSIASSISPGSTSVKPRLQVMSEYYFGTSSYVTSTPPCQPCQPCPASQSDSSSSLATPTSLGSLLGYRTLYTPSTDASSSAASSTSASATPSIQSLVTREKRSAAPTNESTTVIPSANSSVNSGAVPTAMPSIDSASIPTGQSSFGSVSVQTLYSRGDSTSSPTAKSSVDSISSPIPNSTTDSYPTIVVWSTVDASLIPSGTYTVAGTPVPTHIVITTSSSGFESGGKAVEAVSAVETVQTANASQNEAVTTIDSTTTTTVKMDATKTSDLKSALSSITASSSASGSASGLASGSASDSASEETTTATITTKAQSGVPTATKSLSQPDVQVKAGANKIGTGMIWAVVGALAIAA